MRSSDPYRLCDICGFKRRMSELRRNWKGFMVCAKTCWEPKHPQRDRPSHKADEIKHPNGKPKADYVFRYATENMLTNGGFEVTGSAAGEVFSGWENVGHSRFGTASQSTTHKSEGYYSCKILRTSPLDNIYVGRYIYPTEGETLRISFFSWASGVAARYSLFDHSNWNWVSGYSATGKVVGNPDSFWHQTADQIVVPTSCTQIYIRFHGAIATGVPLYYDNVEVRKV